VEPSARSRTDGASREASQIAARLGGDIDEALSDIRIPAFILSRDGLIRWQNASATELLGDSRGRHFSSVIAAESVHDARTEFAKQVVGTARTSDRDVVVRRRDGRRFRAEVHAVSLEDGRQVVGVFGVAKVTTSPPAPPPRSRREALTPRQYQVLAELARGASTEQMMASLGVSRETVRNHVRGVLRALGVHSRLEAVAEGRKRGLIDW
jgi:PAS domain S-box-containing protein